jgi:hypothetical protein
MIYIFILTLNIIYIYYIYNNQHKVFNYYVEYSYEVIETSHLMDVF